MSWLALAEWQVTGEDLLHCVRAARCDDHLTKFGRNNRGARPASLGQHYAAAEQADGGHKVGKVSSRVGDRHLFVGHCRSVPKLFDVHKSSLYTWYMASPYKTETRHHPEGKTCHHYTYHWLTCDEYDALRVRANGHCEICGIAEEETKRGSLVIDHYETHNLHVVRGLLCDFCNTVVMRRYASSGIPGVPAQWEAEAHAYVANSWHQVTPEDLAAGDKFAEDLHRRRLERVQRKQGSGA